MPETGLSGSTSGMWKRSMAELVRHRQTKGSATDRHHLNHRATPRLHNVAFPLGEIRTILHPRYTKFHTHRSRCRRKVGTFFFFNSCGTHRNLHFFPTPLPAD